MEYLIGEIIAFLIVAALLGLLIGWWLTSISSRKKIAEIENEYRLSLERVEAERNEVLSNFEVLRSNSQGRGEVGASTLDKSKLENLDSPMGTEHCLGWPYPVEEIVGVTSTYGNRLRLNHIETTEQLLEQCCEASQQSVLAEQIKTESFVVARWVSMSDLMRIPGVRGQYAELLEVSDIASIGELARQEGAVLAAKIARVSSEQQRSISLPDLITMNGWIERARTLPSVIKSLVPR